MICPFSSKSKSVIWFGPGNGKLTTFVVGDKINKNIRNYYRLRVVGDHIVGEYNLQILNISTEDAGLYKCHSIQNGTAVEATFKLSIIEKPRTLQNKRFFQIKTQMGTPAIIEIEVESLTKPFVSWATNPGGKLGIWAASTEIFPNYVLKSTIVPKLKSHFGKYGIKVRNAAGSIDLDIELQLKDYPVMVHPAVVYCNASTLATLSCELHANYSDQWQNVWTQTRNGQFIKDIVGNVNGNTSSININYCDYIEEGDYKCTWKSKLKTYSATSVVKTNGPPTITESIYLVEKSIFCLAIRFYAQAGYIEIRWFKNDQIIENSTEIDISLEPSAVSLNYSGRYIRENGYISKLCMEGFTYNDIFQYSCQIINKYGSIEFSFHVDWIYQRYQQFLSRTEEMTTVYVGEEEFKEHAEGGISTIVFVLIGAGVFMCGMVIVIITMCYCKSSEKG
ncbi:hemicentin-2-like isoform X2 [Mytilus galloprovincialis]|uniref:hemicentin-2-like isoform X2 n=1 Tax=Mytilus galloprovincialis TaxID=29158 RepID=UPI003F7BBB7F